MLQSCKCLILSILCSTLIFQGCEAGFYDESDSSEEALPKSRYFPGRDCAEVQSLYLEIVASVEPSVDIEGFKQRLNRLSLKERGYVLHSLADLVLNERANSEMIANYISGTGFTQLVRGCRAISSLPGLEDVDYVIRYHRILHRFPGIEEELLQALTVDDSAPDFAKFAPAAAQYGDIAQKMQWFYMASVELKRKDIFEEVCSEVHTPGSTEDEIMALLRDHVSPAQ